jgi:hypothetical protein
MNLKSELKHKKEANKLGKGRAGRVAHSSHLLACVGGSNLNSLQISNHQSGQGPPGGSVGLQFHAEQFAQPNADPPTGIYIVLER